MSRSYVGPQPPSVGELFRQLSISEKEELLFIQLPDTVPVPKKAAKSEKLGKKCDVEDKRASHVKTQVSQLGFVLVIHSLFTVRISNTQVLFVML